jgi:hypothetical protein
VQAGGERLDHYPGPIVLIGFCLVGFQQTAFSTYFHLPQMNKLFDAFNPLGTAYAF